MKTKEKYESPIMERTLVELEDGFCAGSVNVKNTENARIDNQSINTGFDLDTDVDGVKDGYANGEWLK